MKWSSACIWSINIRFYGRSSANLEIAGTTTNVGRSMRPVGGTQPAVLKFSNTIATAIDLKIWQSVFGRKLSLAFVSVIQRAAAA